MTVIPASDDYPPVPPPANWAELPFPPVKANGVLVTAHLGRRPSESLAATWVKEPRLHAVRWELVAAAFGGAVVVLVGLRVVDRRG